MTITSVALSVSRLSPPGLISKKKRRSRCRLLQVWAAHPRRLFQGDVRQVPMGYLGCHHPQPEYLSEAGVRPLDGPSFKYQNEMFYLELRQACSAVVNWQYVELYHTLNLTIDVVGKYGMREMDVEVVAAGLGAFGGFIRYNGPPEA